MKVCLVSALYPPWVLGGAELYTSTLARALAQSADVTVLTTCPPSIRAVRPRHAMEDGVRVYRYFPLNAYHLPRFARASSLRRATFHALDIWNPHSFLAARAVFSREQPDVVHAQNLQGVSTGVLSAARSLGIPVMMTLHDYGLWCRRGTALHGARPCGPRDLLCRVHERVQRRVSETVALAIAPSQFALEAHRRRGFFRSSRQEVLRNPIPPASRIATGKSDRFVMVYLGQLASHKGVDVIVRAVLADPDPRWRLLVVGEGDQEGRLRRLSASDARVEFKGRVSVRERDALLAGADVIVIPSRWDENAPLVALEALAAGVPIVASAVGGLPEIVRPGITGLLVPPDDPFALQAALRRLSDRPSERAALAAGAQTATAEHDLTRHLGALLGWYNELGQRD